MSDHLLLRNWAGNVEFSPARIHHPASEDEVRRIVAGAAAVRVLGTGHSFNKIADTPGDLVVLDRLDGLDGPDGLDGLAAEVRIDRDALTATVPAGMRLADLAARLQAAGYALTALPSLPHISLAGACATGTHGSGDRNPGLAAMVRGLRLVAADGEVVELTRGVSADFDGAVVGLGAVGVVTELTVDVVPTFEISQYVHQGVVLSELIARFEEVFSAGYSVSAFTDWRGDASVWVKGPEAAAAMESGWLGGRLATQAAHPIPGISAENCTEQLGVPGPWHERLPHFRPGFTPSAGEELQSEFFVPRSAVGEALEAVWELGALIGPVVQISEVRTVAADDLWLSPAYRRDSVTLHFTWVPDLAAVTPALAAIEAELLPLGARPHWGKVFLDGPAAALATYERAADFQALLDRRDPEGKFRNAFVRALFPVGG